MLQLKQACERCGTGLPSDSPDARICSYECTFCAACVERELQGKCPNCGGGFERRPQRAADDGDDPFGARFLEAMDGLEAGWLVPGHWRSTFKTMESEQMRRAMQFSYAMNQKTRDVDPEQMASIYLVHRLKMERNLRRGLFVLLGFYFILVFI